MILDDDDDLVSDDEAPVDWSSVRRSGGPVSMKRWPRRRANTTATVPTGPVPSYFILRAQKTLGALNARIVDRDSGDITAAIGELRATAEHALMDISSLRHELGRIEAALTPTPVPRSPRPRPSWRSSPSAWSSRAVTRSRPIGTTPR